MKKNITITICFLFLIIWMSGCSASRVYKMPYAEAENLMLARLGIAKKKLTTNKSGSVSLDEELKKNSYAADIDGSAVELNKYQPDRYIKFTAYHRYNIMAAGGEYFYFVVKKINELNTKVSVNYSDRSVGCIPCFGYCGIPFIFINPGMFRERKILDAIFGP